MIVKSVSINVQMQHFALRPIVGQRPQLSYLNEVWPCTGRRICLASRHFCTDRNASGLVSAAGPWRAAFWPTNHWLIRPVRGLTHRIYAISPLETCRPLEGRSQMHHADLDPGMGHADGRLVSPCSAFCLRYICSTAERWAFALAIRSGIEWRFGFC